MLDQKVTEENTGEKANHDKSCSVGGCGGPGLCPGIALLLAYAVGTGLSFLTGMAWLGWLVGVPLAIILITGAWRFLPRQRSDQADGSGRA